MRRIFFASVYVVLSVLIAAPAGGETAPSTRVQDLIEQGKLEEALAVTNTELQNNEGSITFRFLKGSILTRLNRLDEAAEIFQQLTEEHPELPEPYNNLAVVYAAKGDFDKARQALQNAINTHPSYATAHENMGDIYAKMASQAYNHALRLDQGNLSAKAKLSLIGDLFSLSEPAPVPLAARQPEVKPPPPASPPVPAPLPAVEEPAATTVAMATTAAPPETVMPDAVAAVAVARQAEETAGMEDVRQMLDRWAIAWSSRDVGSYLGYYADDFSPPGGQARSAWSEGRKKRLKEPSFIKIDLSDVEIVMLGNDHAQATFVQGYRSDSFSDRVRKTLLLKKVGEGWFITQESVK